MESNINIDKPRVVLGFSGGMDSTTLLGHYISLGYEVHTCSFFYGSKHNVQEDQARRKIFEYYYDMLKDKGWRPNHQTFDLRQVFSGFKSNLLLGQGEIPEGHYNDDTMSLTVVPGRNLIFASIMAGIAESIGAQTIALGVHSGDHHIYPDCRPEFIEALRKTIQRSSDGKVLRVDTPFENWDKARILSYGYGLYPRVPYEHTRTCYKNQFQSCGKCGSCCERLEAFEKLGIKDPVIYE